MEICNELRRYLKYVLHLDELPVVLEILNGAVRALVPLYVNQQMHQYLATAVDHLHQMLQVVRKFAVMRRTELVSPL